MHRALAGGDVLLDRQEDRRRGQSGQGEGRSAPKQQPGRPPRESPCGQKEAHQGQGIDHGFRMTSQGQAEASQEEEEEIPGLSGIVHPDHGVQCQGEQGGGVGHGPAQPELEEPPSP